MSPRIDVTESSWNDIVKGHELTLVDFWAPWCGWCRRLAPVFEALASEYGDRVKFVKVNVDEELPLAQRFGVNGLPTLKFFCDGQPVAEIVGFLPEKGLRAAIEQALRAFPACAAA